MRKQILIFLIPTLLLSGCAFGQKPGNTGTVSPTPKNPVTVITVPATPTPLPTAVPTKVSIKLGAPSAVRDLSGTYEIVFPSCFDLCDLEADSEHVSSVYKSSSLPNASFSISYILKEKAPKELMEAQEKTAEELNESGRYGSGKVTEGGKTTAVKEIALPGSYFAGCEKETVEVLLVIELDYDIKSLDTALDFHMTCSE